MRASQAVTLSILLLSITGLIQLACNSGSSPTAPSGPSAGENQAGTGTDSGSGLPVAGPAIDLEKSTNGIDADTPPGPSIVVSEAVEWTYDVTNVGDVALMDVVVDDDKLGDVCRIDRLEPGQTKSCTAGPQRAQEGQYANVGRARATDGNSRVSDTDPSHYLGGGGDSVGVEIEKSTNGEDADFEPGPIVNVTQRVEWSYEVTNVGTVALTDFVVNDDKLGEVCRGADLQPGRSVTCDAPPARAIANQYANIGEVIASDGNIRVSDKDPSHYFGSDPAILIDKLTDGKDGPELYVGCPVVWTYEVTNDGNIDLENIAVTDDQGVDVSCRSATLAPGKSMTCRATGTVIDGAYNNLGTVTASAPVDNRLEASDGSSYTGVVKLPTCSDAFADPAELWPPNHKLVSVEILGVVDACGKATDITINSIFQDEPLDAEGDGNTEPDAFGVGTSTLELRAERAGTGNGRVYHVDFTATDARDETCTGTVTVGVPHDKKDTPHDDGPNYDSTGGS